MLHFNLARQELVCFVGPAVYLVSRQVRESLPTKQEGR